MAAKARSTSLKAFEWKPSNRLKFIFDDVEIGNNLFR